MDKLTYRDAQGMANLCGFPEEYRSEILLNAFENLAEYEEGVEAGRLVRLPNTLIAPFELNERYWVCGWDAEDCTLTIQDRVLKAEAARAARGGGAPYDA